MSSVPPALAELCRRVGIEVGFWDVRGHHVDAHPEALVAVLRARGHAVEHPDAADAALAAQDRAVWRELAPPVAVGFGAAPATMGLRLPAHASGDVEFELRGEDGREGRHRVRIEELPVTFAATIDGAAMLERRLTLPPLRPGYHRARVAAAGRSDDALVVQAPARCHAPPGSMCGFGLFAPVYALGGERGAPVGDLGDLAGLARATHGLGGRVVGTLPLLACYYDAPFAPSPYSPVSRLYWNELYLDVAALGAELGAPADEFAAAAATGDAARGPVDYRAAYRVKRAALERLARRGWATPAIAASIEADMAARPRLDDYARFRAAVESTGTTWAAWPAAARAGDLDALPLDDARRRFHLFVQWALRRALASIKAAADRGETAGLYLDLPVGSNPDGYDLWRERAAFAPAMATGAPPDPLAWDGQNWGLPPLEPDALRRQGYRYLIDSLRAHAEAASMLRIDHVMGLHRLFWIPDGMPASHGVYVRYPADELWAVVSLESARGRCAIAGEDLGTVPEEVRPTMAARGVHRLFVAQFDWRRAGEPHGPDDGAARPNPAPFGSIASLDTHDTRTFARFVEDEGLGDPAAAHGPWLAALGEGDADLVLVTLEDLWLERTPQNVPGTADGNWRQRLARTVAEALAEPAARAALATLLERRTIAAERSRRPGP